MNEGEFIWGNLLHFGTRCWGDDGLTPGVHSYSKKPPAPPKDKLNFNEKLWKRLTEGTRKAGGNLVLIDVMEGLKYRKHPELSVSDSWTPERLNAEVRRLKGMGLEPIPKLNFSTTHDNWLGVYHRMVGTPEYYDVCASAIAEVAEVFEKPRFFHIGMDEENYDQTNCFTGYGVFRRGEMWWHDVNFYAKCVEKAGCRPWMWNSYMLNWQDDYLRNCPKSILQSSAYYKFGFDVYPDEPKNKNSEWYWKTHLQQMKLMDEHGFDQIPCSSNFYESGSFAGLVEWCDANLVNKEHLLGYLMASWEFTLPGYCEEKNIAAIAELGTAKKLRRLRLGRAAGLKDGFLRK